MNTFTNDELNLMCIYDTGTRQGLMEELASMKKYLEPDEQELLALTDSVLDKLEKLTDKQYASLKLVPDFDIAD